VAQRIIFNGEPGTVWQNDTGVVRYQFIASLRGTCGACLQYHMAIGPAWPIRIHPHCRCEQRAIAPGREAPNAFVDFRKVLDEMSNADKVAAVGKNVYKLLDRGVIEWKDAVSKYSVRSLKQVVALTKIDVATMEAAGVKSYIAEAAYKSVQTPEQVLIRKHRQELIEKLTQAGVHQEELVRAISTGLTERATVVGGFGTQTSATFAARSHAAELAAILARPRPRRTGEVGPAERLRGTPTVEGDVITIRTNERTITIRPGESAMGRSYEEWRAAPIRTAPTLPSTAQAVDIETAKRKVQAAEAVGTRGRPSPEGHYVRSSEFFSAEATESQADRLNQLTRAKPVQEWAKTGTAETVDISSLVSSQPTLRRSTLLDNLDDPKALRGEHGLPVAFVIDGQIIVEDGHHRIAALAAAGAKQIKVIVVRPQ